MTRLLAALAVLVLVLAVTAAGAAGASRTSKPQLPLIGIADQKPGVFADPLFDELFTGAQVKIARYVVPWDAMDGGFQRQELRAWLAAAAAEGVRPLLSFGHSRREGRQKRRPSPKQVGRQFRRLRAAYPWIREYAVWNEPNHCSQPLCRRPDIAARYYDVMVRACRSCTILGGEVLDSPNMSRWVRRFRREARHDPKIWGLHNYIDVNRFRTTGTRALLRATKGQIWMTETGGIVNRRVEVKIPFEESERHAARALRWLFDRLTPLSPRLRRVYLYHWNPSSPADTWDSALLDLDGKPRSGYRVVAARVQKAVREAKARSLARRVARREADAAGS